MLQGVFIFLLFLGPLVFFHELGHFLVARYFGVRVETFSIGFGPKLFKTKKGDTEYAFSLIPLGGYVKMFGDDPMNADKVDPSQRSFAYTFKSKWARFWIVAAGPLANFILAFILYWALALNGETVPEAKMGMIKETDQLYAKGFRSADIIEKVNDKDLSSFSDIINLQEITSIVVKRKNELVKLEMKLTATEFEKLLQNESRPLRLPLLVDENANLFILTQNSKFNHATSLEDLLASENNTYQLYAYSGKISEPVLEKNIAFADKQEFAINQIDKMDFILKNLKLYPADLVVDQVMDKTPASDAGIKTNDLFISVSGVPLHGFFDFKDVVEKSKGSEPLSLKVLRKNQLIDLAVTPKMMGEKNQQTMRIGVSNYYHSPELNKVKRNGVGLFSSIPYAMNKTFKGLTAVGFGLKKLLFGEAALNQLGGPLAIGKIAQETFDIGITSFLSLMAIFSINLGLLNLMPIPVLDGGHILFIFFELLNGGPLSRKKLVIAQQVGFSLLMLLMVFALYNDVKRFIF